MKINKKTIQYISFVALFACSQQATHGSNGHKYEKLDKVLRQLITEKNFCPNGNGRGISTKKGALTEFAQVHSTLFALIQDSLNKKDFGSLVALSSKNKQQKGADLVDGFSWKETGFLDKLIGHVRDHLVQCIEVESVSATTKKMIRIKRKMEKLEKKSADYDKLSQEIQKLKQQKIQNGILSGVGLGIFYELSGSPTGTDMVELFFPEEKSDSNTWKIVLFSILSMICGVVLGVLSTQKFGKKTPPRRRTSGRASRSQ